MTRLLRDTGHGAEAATRGLGAQLSITTGRRSMTQLFHDTGHATEAAARERPVLSHVHARKSPQDHPRRDIQAEKKARMAVYGGRLVLTAPGAQRPRYAAYQLCRWRGTFALLRESRRWRREKEAGGLLARPLATTWQAISAVARITDQRRPRPCPNQSRRPRGPAEAPPQAADCNDWSASHNLTRTPAQNSA